VSIGLERQQRQHMVHVATHPARSTRPPGPHAGRDIVDDGYRRTAPTQALGDRMRELGAVNDDKRVRLGGDRRSSGAIDTGEQFGQPRQNRAGPHYRHVLQRELRDEPLLGHLRAAHTDVTHATTPAFIDGRHQLGAERITRGLASDNEEPEILALGRIGSLPHGWSGIRHHDRSYRLTASHNTRNRPRSSASRPASS
jgi:hypothetical protein